MIKFSDWEYIRPDTDKAVQALSHMAEVLENAKNPAVVLECYAEASHVLDDMATAATIASIRHTVDTTDAFYAAENDYFDERTPLITDKTLSFYRALLANPYKEALAGHYGEILLQKMELAVKSSDERLIPLQQQENALETQYEKLYAGAKIPFDGKELTVAQLGPYKESTNAATRRAAFEAEGKFFDGCREELDDLYTRLVDNRTQQAKTLGYADFTALGDIRMERLGYTRADIRACRAEISAGVVPFAARMKQNQTARLGLPSLKFQDNTLAFKDGNPTPKGTPEEILASGRKMYHELSPETTTFIDFMMEGGLFDVLAKPGKAPGGYCTSIPCYKSPFIFSNFNGTAGDVDVLTHEAGHAFQAYLAAKEDLPPELRSPGLESCEIHSMSMEFLTAPFHHLFFSYETDKYTLSHAEDALYFLPYGCMVDEFQDEVYTRGHLTAEERNTLWLELEQKYRPWVNFDGLPFYTRGAGWQRQLHIYTAPFYYIDYVLASAVALQFFLAAGQNRGDAWQKYLTLTKQAGRLSYTDLVHSAGLKTPFEPGVMEDISKQVAGWAAGFEASHGLGAKT